MSWDIFSKNKVEYMLSKLKTVIDKKQDVIQLSVMPETSEELVGKMFQYTGETNANFTNGYFYACTHSGGEEYIQALPVMTSNTEPSGVASASSTFVNYEQPWNCFKQSLDGYPWIAAQADAQPWIRYDFPAGTSKVVKKIKVWNTNTDSWYPAQFKLQGSNDNGSTWVDLVTCNIVNTAASALNEYLVDNSVAYNSYRIFITQKAVQFVGFQRIDLLEKNPALLEWTRKDVQPSGSSSSVSADDVSYDNTSSALAADNVQDAIDELAQGSVSVDSLTIAQVNALLALLD